jgi:hypothetical protein
LEDVAADLAKVHLQCASLAKCRGMYDLTKILLAAPAGIF